jgi:transketolase
MISTEELANKARIEIVQMAHRARASHVASSLSVVDILSVLYGQCANISSVNTDHTNRDIVILSKGHAAASLYSVLALKEFFPMEWLSNYCGDGSPIGGHVTFKGVPGVELSTGSLGHGLPYGLGIALARKRLGISGHVFVVMSDGECDEGTTWESALLANQLQLNNLTVIIDRNFIQSLGGTEETIRLEPFADKWKAFSWNVLKVNGNHHEELKSAVLQETTSPKVIIAQTTKGSGVRFMENSVLWHYKWPDDSQLKDALLELGVSDA